MKNEHVVMKDLPAEERPFEKCEKMGPESLSNAELLAMIINSGTKEKKALDIAYSMLNMDPAHPGLEGIISLDFRQLKKIHGIGRVRALQLLAIFELSKRITRLKITTGIQITSPSIVSDYYTVTMRHLKQEELHMMMLDTRQHLIGEELITKGTINMSLIDPREIFIRALKAGAVGIILVHNHPSGDPTPSEDDIRATQMVQRAGEIIGIHLIDHIVIGSNSYSSILK